MKGTIGFPLGQALEARGGQRAMQPIEVLDAFERGWLVEDDSIPAGAQEITAVAPNPGGDVVQRVLGAGRGRGDDRALSGLKQDIHGALELGIG